MADLTGKKVSLELIAAPAIKKRILVVRDRQVMLDEDLADLYGVATKRLISRSNGTSSAFQKTSCFSWIGPRLPL